MVSLAAHLPDLSCQPVCDTVGPTRLSGFQGGGYCCFYSGKGRIVPAPSLCFCRHLVSCGPLCIGFCWAGAQPSHA